MDEQGPEEPLGDRMETSPGIGRKDLFLDGGSQERQVRDLRHAGAAQAREAADRRVVLNEPAGDELLEMVTQDEQDRQLREAILRREGSRWSRKEQVNLHGTRPQGSRLALSQSARMPLGLNVTVIRFVLPSKSIRSIRCWTKRAIAAVAPRTARVSSLPSAEPSSSGAILSFRASRCPSRSAIWASRVSKSCSSAALRRPARRLKAFTGFIRRRRAAWAAASSARRGASSSSNWTSRRAVSRSLASRAATRCSGSRPISPRALKTKLSILIVETAFVGQLAQPCRWAFKHT